MYSIYDEMKLQRVFPSKIVERLVESSEELFSIGG